MTPAPLDDREITRLRGAAEDVGFVAWHADETAHSAFDGPNQIACCRTTQLEHGGSPRRDAERAAFVAAASPATILRLLARLAAAERRAAPAAGGR